MVVEDQGTSKSGGYVGGFFQLFGMSSKSRKKLFSGKSEGSAGKLPTGGHLMIEDEHGGGFSNTKESDSSCVSSTTDDEECRIRAPGVVARLMGLDSLPSNDVSEPHSTPFSESRPLPYPHYQMKNPEFRREYRDLSSNNQENKIEGFSRKAVDSRPQKLQRMSSLEKSPIQKFQTETLPLKPAKSNPRTHHKLLSPLKSPGFVSARNASQIMEAATKILEPELQVNTRNNFPNLGSSSIPTIYQSRPLEVPRRPLESSAMKYLKGQCMNKGWNGLEDAPSPRVAAEERVPTSTLKVPISSSKQEFTFLEENRSSGFNDKGKSISLAVQAKVNVQRGLSSGSSQMLSKNSYNKNLMVLKEHDGSKFNQPLKNEPNIQKNKPKKSIPGSPNVLRQNNQKQNCSTNKDKLPSKPTVSSQQSRKIVSGDASLGWEQRKQKGSKDHAVSVRDSNHQIKNLTGSKVADNSGYTLKGRENKGTPDLEKNISSSRTKDSIQKKRCLEGDLNSQKNTFVDDFFVDEGDGRLLPSNATTGECSKWTGDNRRSLWNTDKAASGCRSLDVVSFTFTSPMRPMPGPHSSIDTLEKQNVKNNVHREQNVLDPKIENFSTSGFKIPGGDALNILLEQKLRELTSGMHLASSNSPKTDGSGIAIATASVLQDLISALNTAKEPKEPEMNPLPPRLRIDSLGHKSESVYSSTNGSSTNGQMMLDANKKLHIRGRIEDCSSSSTNTTTNVQKECHYDQPSPMSILEASFSNESCNSSESWESIHGYRLYPTFPTENSVCLTNLKKNPSLEAEAELSDSATSTLVETEERENSAKVGLLGPKKEMEYVREIINNSELMFEGYAYAVGRASGIIDSNLFERLENQKTRSRIEGENNESWELDTKVLFDCVSECLDSKYSRYGARGYGAWSKGMAIVGRRDGLAEEVYKEILGWTGMWEWMVDDIVEKDMSSHLGRWTDFEIESFEIGMDIEREILESLVDEVIIDVLS